MEITLTAKTPRETLDVLKREFERQLESLRQERFFKVKDATRHVGRVDQMRTMISFISAIKIAE